MSPDTLTILRSRGRRLAKLIRPGPEIEGYDRARTYDISSVPFSGLFGLAEVLDGLLDLPDRCVVRGAIADRARTIGVRRLVHPDPETGDQPTLRDVPSRLVALDCDGLPAPEGLDLHDLDTCGEAAVAMMPEAFRGTACIVQATAGHALKPGLRLRLWFLLERGLTGVECQRWLRAVPGVDPSTLRAAQAIFTAAPVFEAMADPLPQRLTIRPGAETVACPTSAELAPPPRPAADPSRLVTDASRGAYVRSAMIRAATVISSAPVDSRHPTAVAEAWGLARFVVAGLMTADELVRLVDGALEQAGKPRGEGAKIGAWAAGQRTDAGNLPAGIRA